MARLKASAVRLKIRRTRIVVCQGVKQIVYLKVKELRQLRKRKKAGAKGKTVVANTPAAKVKKAAFGGEISKTAAKRPSPKPNSKGIVANGCGVVLANRRKRTKGSVSA